MQQCVAQACSIDSKCNNVSHGHVLFPITVLRHQDGQKLPIKEQGTISLCRIAQCQNNFRWSLSGYQMDCSLASGENSSRYPSADEHCWSSRTTSLIPETDKIPIHLFILLIHFLLPLIVSSSKSSSLKKNPTLLSWTLPQ